MYVCLNLMGSRMTIVKGTKKGNSLKLFHHPFNQGGLFLIAFYYIYASIHESWISIPTQFGPGRASRGLTGVFEGLTLHISTTFKHAHSQMPNHVMNLF